MSAGPRWSSLRSLAQRGPPQAAPQGLWELAGQGRRAGEPGLLACCSAACRKRDSRAASQPAICVQMVVQISLGIWASWAGPVCSFGWAWWAGQASRTQPLAVCAHNAAQTCTAPPLLLATSSSSIPTETLKVCVAPSCHCRCLRTLLLLQPGRRRRFQGGAAGRGGPLYRGAGAATGAGAQAAGRQAGRVPG